MALVFFDIDGTLAEGTHIPASARSAIGRLRSNGHLAFICSGRPRGYAERTFSDVADGFVCSNGRLAFLGGEHLVDEPLGAAKVGEVTARLDAVDAGYAFFGEWEAWYCGNAAYRHVAEEACSPFHDGIDGTARAYNFDVYFDDAAHRERITEALGEGYVVNPHGPHPSADVTVAGFGKGDALRAVSAALGVPAEDIVAFGDGINDISMIEAAATGVAMGNAAPELKAVADYVTSDIGDDGVAHALRHLGLA